MPQPITIILYGVNDEPEQTYSKAVVSWGLLKRAIRLSEQLDLAQEADQAPQPDDWGARFHRWIHRNDRPISSAEQMMDTLGQFVVDVFDNQFTVADLERGAEAGEILTVLRTIVGRAQTMVPTNPPPKTRKRH